MTEFNQIYKCMKCGNIAAVMHTGAGEMTCCGEPMKMMREGGSEGAAEKHVPVIEKIPDGYRVKIGSVPHVMEEKHWIEWIELVADGRSYRRFLKPGQAPEAEFHIKAPGGVIAREYCNLHGHWKAEA